jgi:glycosyltransferase involved in cell wall biosynthesis
MMGRWLGMLDTIGQFDPDLVMFVGLKSPLVFPLYAARPVLALGIHAVAPMVPADVWLTADPSQAGVTSVEWDGALPAAFGHYHPFRIKLGPEGAPLVSAELGIETEQLAMITVGARLNTEITGPWAARMLAMLARHPQLVWVLAGGQGRLPPALAGADPAQIRLLPHRTDLRSVLRCCDLYVNPPRVGGGFSAAEAMAEALPVLAYADGDAGSKLGDMAPRDEQSYFDRLEALLASPALRAATGAAMQAHFRSSLDLDRAGPSLRQACELALERFRARQACGTPRLP